MDDAPGDPVPAAGARRKSPTAACIKPYEGQVQLHVAIRQLLEAIVTDVVIASYAPSLESPRTS